MLFRSLDCYDFMPDISDEEALGKYYLQELDAFSIPEELIDYIDYEAYGCNAVVSENGEFVQDGYIRRNGSSFYEFYDGQPEGIPKEYRVMSVQAEPPHIAAMCQSADLEREYAAEAEAFVQTPESILEQVQLEKERVRDRFRALTKTQSKATPKKHHPKER